MTLSHHQHLPVRPSGGANLLTPEAIGFMALCTETAGASPSTQKRAIPPLEARRLAGVLQEIVHVLRQDNTSKTQQRHFQQKAAVNANACMVVRWL